MREEHRELETVRVWVPGKIVTITGYCLKEFKEYGRDQTQATWVHKVKVLSR